MSGLSVADESHSDEPFIGWLETDELDKEHSTNGGSGSASSLLCVICGKGPEVLCGDSLAKRNETTFADCQVL